jgi:hypothetical protein
MADVEAIRQRYTEELMQLTNGAKVSMRYCNDEC